MSFLLALLLSLGLLFGPDDGIPKARQGTFALVNARIETVTNGVIERGTVVIRNDRILAIGADVAVPSEAEVIDCTGLTVYPGLIDTGSLLGLTEVGSDPRTQDYRELGLLTPHMEALTAVNPNSVLIPVTRVSGVTTVLTEPQGNLFPGVAALIHLHGYTPAQMFAGMRAMILEFPRTGRAGPWDRRTDEEIEKAAEKALKQLNDTWAEAVLAARIDSAFQANPANDHAPARVPEMQAMIPVVRGQMPLLLKVDAANDILKALDWVKEKSLHNVIFSGVAEGWRVADKIAAAGIPCFVGPVLATPTRPSDRYDKPYANAGLLRQAGVRIAIRSGEAENTRNLPYHAGFAATYGLGREEALRAVTIAPAEILGMAAELGSLEAGKRASLFVTDGDPFETKTQVRHVFIDGYQIPLVSRQTQLYEEFLHREPGLQKHQPPKPGTN
jgi:imidazolonepropionase-like amidohydrolase